MNVAWQDRLDPVASIVAAEKPSLIGLSRAELAEALREAGVPEAQLRMRAAQLWHWLYFRGATDFSAMTNMAKRLRASLAERRPRQADQRRPVRRHHRRGRSNASLQGGIHGLSF